MTLIQVLCIVSLCMGQRMISVLMTEQAELKKLGQSRIQENEICVQSGQERMLEGWKIRYKIV